MMGLSDSERISMMRSAVLTQSTRVTDRQTELAWHIRAIAYILSRVKIVRLYLRFLYVDDLIGVGAQSVLGGTTFLPEKYARKKLSEYQNFT